MAWLKLEDNFARHPKLVELAELLQIELVQAQGHVINLWCWTLEMSPGGDLTRFRAGTLEEAARWKGDPGEFVKALELADLLDCSGEKVSIHGWMRRAGSFREAQRSAERRKNDRKATAVRPRSDQVTTAERPGHDRGATAKRPQEKRGEEKRREDKTREADAMSVTKTLELVPSAPAFSADQVLSAWQRTCVPAGLPSVRKLSKKRRASISARTAEIPKGENPRSWWEHYFARIADAPFCLGSNDRGWKATLDWAIRSEDIVNRVFEGRYDQSYEKKHPIDREIEELLSNDRIPTVHDMPRPPTLGSGGGFDRLDGLPGGSNEN